MAAIGGTLTLAEFWDELRISAVMWPLGEAMSTSETRGGEILTARLGTRLWSGTATIPPATGANQDRLMALVDLIRSEGISFLCYDPRRAYPQNDLDGSVQGANTCSVNTAGSDRRLVTVSGPVNGFVFGRGDLIGIEFGTSQYYLGRVVADKTVSGGTAELQVVPPLPAGVQASDTVTLRKPVMKAIYSPDSYKAPRRNPVVDEGFSFDFVQTLT